MQESVSVMWCREPWEVLSMSESSGSDRECCETEPNSMSCMAMAASVGCGACVRKPNWTEKEKIILLEKSFV